MINRLRLAFAASLFATCSFTLASPVGYTDYASGLGGNATWSLWDVFSATTFSNLGANLGTSGAILNSVTTAGSPPGAMLLPDGEGTANSTIYNGGSSVVYQILGHADTGISSFYLQIKEQDAPADGLTTYFVPTLNGVGASSTSVGSAFIDGDLTYRISTWTWTGLGIADGDSVTVAFSGAPHSHRAYDGIRMDSDGTIAAIPEPSTCVLLVLTFGVVGLAGMCHRTALSQWE